MPHLSLAYPPIAGFRGDTPRNDVGPVHRTRAGAGSSPHGFRRSNPVLTPYRGVYPGLLPPDSAATRLATGSDARFVTPSSPQFRAARASDVHDELALRDAPATSW